MNWPAVACFYLTGATMLGAFGAHALKDRLDEYSLGVWEKAVFYHFIHALGLLVTPLLAKTELIGQAAAQRVCWFLATGVLIFSGSLYTLAFTGVRAAGALAPVGGTLFLFAWTMLGWNLARGRR
ncbi:MAG: DUF423 domain-containing protein [Bryobacteraceae bacterium]|nr:DUF423 domain-containing protein [Bryobacteraceae bacterium]